MMEWGPAATPNEQLERMLAQRVDFGQIIELAPGAPPLSDDRPVNEYCLLRELYREELYRRLAGR
jgi:hypothetical protein